MERQFNELVLKSQRILVTSHISPDPDAVCSSLLLGEILRENFPDKKIVNALEELPAQALTFLHGYSRIVFGKLIDTIQKQKPDLIIITDADYYDRVSREDGPAIHEYVQKQGVKLAVIDHHEPTHIDPIDVHINTSSAAACQEVFQLCFTKLDMKRPKDYEQTALIGILSDTNRFMYHYPNYSATLAIAGELIDAGVDVQKLDALLNRYSVDQMRVFSHLAANVKAEVGYTYSYITDKFAKRWVAEGKAISDFKLGRERFVDQFIRNISDNLWGFAVYQDLTTPGTYLASFRSTRGAKNVQKLAKSLGGGGHTESAATKVEASTIEEAIATIKRAL